MSDIMSAGGSFSVVVLGLGALGAVVILALAGMAFAKRRVPLTFLVALPICTAAIGAVGAWMNAGTTLASLGALEPSMIPNAASIGLFDALAADWFSRWVAAYLFAAGAWAAALGAFFAGPESRMTPIASGLAALLTVMCAGVLVLFAFTKGLAFSSIMPLVTLVLISGFAVVVAALKRAVFEQAERVAGMRFASGICMLLAVIYGGRALAMGSRMDAFGPGGLASEADDLMGAITMWFDVVSPLSSIGWVAFAFAFLIALAGFYNELGEVVSRFTLVDVTLTLGLVTMLAVVRVVGDFRVDDLTEVSTNHPAAVMFAELGSDLPAALVSVEEEVKGVMVNPGGFGDVFVFEDSEWRRKFQWNGGGWDVDDSTLDTVQPSAIRPLLVIGSGEEAVDLPKLIEGMGGEVLMLMRAHEVKSVVDIPPQLAYLQVTFLPLTLSGDAVDLATELWAPAGSREVNWGVTSWYGDEADEEPVAYYDAVFAETSAPGIHVGIHERARVKGIVGTCLPAILTASESDVELNDKWCRLLESETEDIRDQAMEVWELPETENFKSSWGRATDIVGGDDVIGQDRIVQRLSHELGAVDYCLTNARDEGEEIGGRMDLELRFNRKGKVSTMLGERSKYESSVAVKCVKDRVKDVLFVLEEDVWPERPEPEEGEDPLPPEDPETITLTLAVDK